MKSLRKLDIASASCWSSILWVTMVTLLCLNLRSGSDAVTQEDHREDNLARQLCAEDETAQEAVVEAFRERRSALIDSLIPLIDPDNIGRYSPETRAKAAYILGEIRAVEAAPVLALCIDMREPGPHSSDLSPYQSPMTGALLKIGNPAVPPLLANLRTRDDIILGRTSVLVLNAIVRGRSNVLELLERERARSKDPLEAQRFEQWIEYVNQLYASIERTGEKPR